MATGKDSLNSPELDFDPDVDYAQGYYDGVDNIPAAKHTVPYLKGWEDGRADMKEMNTWSGEYSAARLDAYHLWMEAKGE